MHGRWHLFRWLSTGLYLILLTAGPAGSGTTAPTPDLSGTWTLNDELSQDPRAALREAQEKNRPAQGGGGRRGGRRGGGGGGVPGGGDPGTQGGQGGRARQGAADGSGAESDEHSGGAEGAGGEFGLGARELHIAGTGPQLTLSGADGREERVLYTDGRKVSAEKAGVGTVKTQAQWKDGALEVVTQLPKGRTKTEIFEMTHDRKRLYVLVTLEGYGRMPTVTFKRVYDPEPAPAAAPAPGPAQEDDDYDIVEDA
jgi:hypothetical protein